MKITNYGAPVANYAISHLAWHMATSSHRHDFQQNRVTVSVDWIMFESDVLY